MKLPAKLLVCLLLTSILSTVSVAAQDDDFEDEEEDGVIEVESDEAPAQEPVFAKPKYVKPVASGNTFFTEPFDSEADFNIKWVLSQAKKADTDEAIAKYDGIWKVEEPSDNPIEEDLGLVLKSRAKHHAVSAKLDRPYEFNGKPFVVQYEVKFQNGQECGGAYIKLLTDSGVDLNKFHDKTGYTIMFGPDRCGKDNKLHFIFRHKNPVNGKFEEKHAKKPAGDLETYFSDKRTHLYTLVVSPDNSFQIFVDQSLINSGNLLEDMNPAVNPPAEIVDPEDKKPQDWDEREKIPDPDATKPDDWDEDEPEMIVDENAVKPEGWLEDEPELVPDPEAKRPEDWDDDMDGEWEPPMIPNVVCETAPGCGEWEQPKIKNPKYKGKWRAPLIDNPSYKGKWLPRKIPNPEYFEDKEPYRMTNIGAVGLELWSMSDGILFDNFIITDDKKVADDWAADTWQIKSKHEMAGSSSARSVVDAIMDATNERPWLWAVILVVVVLPIVLVIAYCCMPDKAKPDHPKKTDKPTPDVKDTDKESDEKESDESDSQAAEVKESGDDAAPKTKPKKKDLEAEEEDGEADNEEDDGKPATRSSPRKRKTKARKD